VWFFWPHFCAGPLRSQSASFAIFNCNFWNSGACNIPLERYFEDLSINILYAPRFQKFQLKIAKEVDCAHSGLALKHGKKNRT